MTKVRIIIVLYFKLMNVKLKQTLFFINIAFLSKDLILLIIYLIKSQCLIFYYLHLLTNVFEGILDLETSSYIDVIMT